MSASADTVGVMKLAMLPLDEEPEVEEEVGAV